MPEDRAATRSSPSASEPAFGTCKPVRSKQSCSLVQAACEPLVEGLKGLWGKCGTTTISVTEQPHGAPSSDHCALLTASSMVGRTPVAHDIVAAHFSFYGPKQIQSLSPCEVCNPIIFDELRRPTEGGLYDPKMGPLENLETCVSCGLTYTECPGHMGHINLNVPVYHPMLFPTLMSILGRKCFACNHFRMRKDRTNRYVQLLTLCADGKITEAANLVDAGLGCALIDSKAGEDTLDAELQQYRDQYVDELLEVAEQAMAKLSAGRSDGSAVSSHALEYRREIVESFLKRANSRKCENCGAAAVKLRKEGCRKIFQCELSKNAKKSMEALGKKLHNVLGNDPDEEQPEEAPVEEVEEEDEDEDLGPGDASAEYLTTLHVEKHLELLWQNEQDIINLIWGIGFQRPIGAVAKSSPEMFFYRVLPVPPNRFRPYQVRGDEIVEHPQNSYLTKIINANRAVMEHARPTDPEAKPNWDKAIQQWIELQDGVNSFIDSSKAQGIPVNTVPPPGIRQVLEKKEGLFRKHMMGKRVNFAARSVISPDVNIETNEIGVPLYFAQKLSFTEPVTPYNEKQLREAVINGPNVYPGANFIVDDRGGIITLASRSKDQRVALSRTLQKTSFDAEGGVMAGTKKVGRHLRTGDMMLSNRQPTLHKPGILAHKARVMMTEKTIRMHYANCNTFNADFDGDEMNLHLPQSQHARAEAKVIAAADEQYVVPKDGSPLRGLIQDHVIAGVTMTSLNCFLEKGEFMQLLYSAFPNAESSFVCPAPAILKPKQLWTGKQVISAVLGFLTKGLTPINMEKKCKVKGALWAPHLEEGQIIIRGGELMTGVLGKCQFGASEFGLVHSVCEIYSTTLAGSLLSALGRLFTYFLQQVGFTCGIQDLLVQQGGEKERRKLMAEAAEIGAKVSAELVGVEVGASSLRALLNRHLRDPANEETLDRKMMTALNPVHRKIVDVCLPGGQVIPFPRNKFLLMTTTGAKGGQALAAQLFGYNCWLAGKSLPCYEPYDPAPIAGGFIAHRFLTGIKPQEYFFHCMAGREGLVDTAVKTSRSGYLQRCLIKHLEGLSVHYDGTVRNSDNSVVQFRYGEDGIDVSKTAFLFNFKFFAQNFNCLAKQLAEDVHIQSPELVKALAKLKKRREEPSEWRKAHPPVVSKDNPGTTVGCLSERFEDALEDYIAKNPDELLTNKQQSTKKIPADMFRALMMIKWIRSVAQPGEAVGLLASQSIGEPSTQMTLNTFHHAGQSDFNVTMGIPRLREITMTASKKIKTPWLKVPAADGVSKEQIEHLCRGFYRLRLVELLENVTVEDTLYTPPSGQPGDRQRQYRVRIFVRLTDKHTEVYGLSVAKLQEKIEAMFLPKLHTLISKEIEKTSGKKKASAIARRSKKIADKVGENEDDADEKDAKPEKQPEQEDSDADEGVDEADVDGDGGAGLAAQKAKKGQMATYDADDDGEMDVDEEGDQVPLRHKVDDEDDEEVAAEEQQPKIAAAARSSKSVQMRADLLAMNYLSDFSHGSNDGGVQWSEMLFHIPPSERKLLMPSLVQTAASGVVLHSVKGVNRAGVVEQDGKMFVQTDGSNFQALQMLPHLLKVNEIQTNDVNAALETYGVEAARTVIQNEIRAVFGAYGITSDLRHLGLLADYMTFSGGFRPLNRQGIEANTSPFLKMSFETTTHFLESATVFGDVDHMRSPSSCIVLGKPVPTGTGSFDVIQPLQFGKALDTNASQE